MKLPASFILIFALGAIWCAASIALCNDIQSDALRKLAYHIKVVRQESQRFMDKYPAEFAQAVAQGEDAEEARRLLFKQSHTRIDNNSKSELVTHDVKVALTDRTPAEWDDLFHGVQKLYLAFQQRVHDATVKNDFAKQRGDIESSRLAVLEPLEAVENAYARASAQVGAAGSLSPQIIAAFVFGVVFVVTLLVVAIKFPDPTQFQYVVFRIILALAAAGVAAMIPGIVNVELTGRFGILIRAGGALAVFVVTFFCNPAKLVAKAESEYEKQSGSVVATHQSEQFLPVLDKLDAQLQDALALAALQAKRDNEEIVSTRHVFAAFMRLRPGQLPQLLARLPSDALPPPMDSTIPADKQILSRPLKFSGCVRDSLRSLAPHATSDRKLATEDVFVDIARHGSGESVRKLRTHGIDSGKVADIVKQLGWKLIERGDSARPTSAKPG